MLVETSTPLLHKSNVQSTTAFKISASAHAFKILSSGLYSNKIAAVLREIGCNAVDAHVAVGTPDRPIDVKLPNTLDARFYIQDYGPGLSDEFVKHIYTTYFESTKTGGNDQIGGFGLGSKSPFAYTDQFTVESSHGGEVRTYVAYIDDNGAPSISLMSSCPAPAEWPHGIRVSLPVKTSDVYEFRSSAQKVFQYFRVKPNMLGSEPIKDFEYKFLTDKFAVPSDNGGYSRVVMGGVAYQFQLDAVWPYTAENSVRQICQEMSMEAWQFFLPIGAVPVTPSRESIDMTPAARATIKAAMLDAWYVVADQFSGEVAKLENTIESHRDVRAATHEWINKLLPNTSWNCVLLPEFERRWTANGFPVNTMTDTAEELRRGCFTIAVPRNDTDKYPTIRELTWNPKRAKMVSTEKWWGGLQLRFDFKQAVAVFDPKGIKRHKDRLRQLLVDGEYDSILVIEPHDHPMIDIAVAEFDKLPVKFQILEEDDLPELQPYVRGAANGLAVTRTPVEDRTCPIFITGVSAVRYSINPASLRVGDVPDNSRVFIMRVRSGRKGRSGKVCLQADPAGKPIGAEVHDYMDVLSALDTLGRAPSHVAVVSQGEQKYCRLIKSGWTSLFHYAQTAVVLAGLTLPQFSNDPKHEPASFNDSTLRQLVRLAACNPAKWAEVSAYLSRTSGSELIEFVNEAALGATRTGQVTECVLNAVARLRQLGITNIGGDIGDLDTHCKAAQGLRWPELDHLNDVFRLGLTKASVLSQLLLAVLPVRTSHIQAAA